ncbi:MAG: glycosyltransferase [Deltaproteobacteria bacterium]|nr:glycosyltransferase [Deltaproteobacteria bacterium]
MPLTGRKRCCGKLIDPARTHFLGRVPYDTYRTVLQVSAAHVYLTYPFVLSWSMLEAMASGCLVIGSRTAPVEEVLRDGENGLLVDFFDKEAIADRVIEAVENPERYAAMRELAREEVATQFSRKEGLRRYRDLVQPIFRPQLVTVKGARSEACL